MDYIKVVALRGLRCFFFFPHDLLILVLGVSLVQDIFRDGVLSK